MTTKKFDEAPEIETVEFEGRCSCDEQRACTSSDECPNWEDGETYEVVREGGSVYTRKPFEERRKDLLDDHDGGPYVAEVETDWGVWHELVTRSDYVSSHVLVTADLFRDFAKRVDEQSASTEGVRLDVSPELPIVATLEDGTEIALAPRTVDK